MKLCAFPIAVLTTMFVAAPGVTQVGYLPPGGTGYDMTTNAPMIVFRRGQSPRPARANEIKPGDPVYSTNGVVIGKVALVDGRGAVVTSPQSAARVSFDAFGLKSDGLLLDITPARFDALAQAAARNDSH